jgi:hypothetical protein
VSFTERYAVNQRDKCVSDVVKVVKLVEAFPVQLNIGTFKVVSETRESPRYTMSSPCEARFVVSFESNKDAYNINYWNEGFDRNIFFKDLKNLEKMLVKASKDCLNEYIKRLENESKGILEKINEAKKAVEA